MDEEALARDLLLHGTSISLDGRRIDPADFWEKGHPLVEVIQADRDAAADIGRRFAHWRPKQIELTIAGEADEYPIVQAFARHRIAAQAGE